jgi:hypothetical protein
MIMYRVSNPVVTPSIQLYRIKWVKKKQICPFAKPYNKMKRLIGTAKNKNRKIIALNGFSISMGHIRNTKYTYQMKFKFTIFHKTINGVIKQYTKL